MLKLDVYALRLVFINTIFMMLCSCAAFAADIELKVDITASRSIRLASFEKSALDRAKYFRTYHIPGTFDEKIDDDLKKIDAIPGRGTGPYYAFDKQHSFILDNDKKPADEDFKNWVNLQNERYSRIYKTAAQRYPGVKHALSAVGVFPEMMRKDKDGRILKSEFYDDFATLIVGFYDRLKADNCSLPSWFTTLNEPTWEWGGDEFAKYSTALAKAMAVKHPDIKVCGPCSAWPYPQTDWKRWYGWEQKFIEIAGADIGAYDLHFYSKGYWAYTDERLMGDPLCKKQASPSLYVSQKNGCTTVWDYGRLDGLLDLVAAYHSKYHKSTPKPMIISEFGRQGIEPQLGPWENEFKPWLYMTTVVRFWMSFMDRPEVELTIPFILGQADMVYGASRGQAVYNRPGAPADKSSKVTRFRDFYKFFKDLNGQRLSAKIQHGISSDGGEILIRAFADGKTVYLMLHNGKGFPDGTQTINISTLTGNDSSGQPVSVVSSGIKRMRWEGPVPTDHRATELEGVLRIDADYSPLAALDNITLAGEETAMIRLELSAEPLKAHHDEFIDYSMDTLIEPDKDGRCRLTVDLPAREGKLVDAAVYISFARDGGFATNPTVIFNGKRLSGFDMAFSKGIKDFHRAVAIPVDIATIKDKNQILVVFDKDQCTGGYTKVVSAKMITTRQTAQ